MSTEILDFRKMSTEEIKAKIKKDIEEIQEEVANGMYLNSTLYKEREIAAIKSNLNVQVGNMNIRRETENFIAQCNFIEDLK
jgi:hypothetical protein